MANDVIVLLGTTKGVFLLSPQRGGYWSLSGPHCNGAPINHVIGDSSTGTLWAAGGNEWFGKGVWRSRDLGQTWTLSDDAFSETADVPVEALWSLGRVEARLFLGTKPAELFVSDDDGDSWTHEPALTQHPSRSEWFPGNAGLILHTILGSPQDVQKIWVGISAVGVFGSEDGGATWEPRNRGTRNDYAKDPFPEYGQCVHNIQRADAPGDLLYQQNHCGTYRSEDGGREWRSIEDGLPSSFGFPIAVHPRKPDTIWVFPLNGDSKGRFPPEASAKVWRSKDGGVNWQPLGNGLPENDCFFTVLRQAMAVDHSDRPGLYFGTNSGSVFASLDEGDNWREVSRHLPTILSVETLTR